MSIDGIMIRALSGELQTLAGGRINKIHQPTADEIVMQIRASGSSCKLLLSANPTYPRVHLTERQYQNPQEAPMFCMLLRKYCEGGIIESLRQIGSERILHMDVRHRDELGDLTIRRIIIEVMGRHSNIILIDPDNQLILDGIHHVTPAISAYRVVMPGSRYVLPPEQDKLDPLIIEPATLRTKLQEELPSDSSPADAAKYLVSSFAGLSPLSAKEIVHRSQWDEHHDTEQLQAACLDWMQAAKTGAIQPTIVQESSSGKEYFSILPLTHLDGTATQFANVSACLEAYFGEKAAKDRVKQRVSDMLRFLQNERAKNIKKLDKLKETQDDAKDADRYRILGELLTAHLHLMKRGDKQVEVMNYYDEEQAMLAVELDPQLTPSENAQRYFRKYTKSKNSVQAMEEQLKTTRQEIDYLETLLQQIEDATLQDVEEIREELVAGGYMRDRQKHNRKKKKETKPSLTCYTSSEGIEIYVGKNNLQNEYLTNRLAQSSDTWLHTKDIPGSHVVIRAKEFGDVTLEEAALLSAYFSKAKSSSQVPVDYTYIRHVRKPSGAKPGFVIYDHQKTLFVTPDEQRIQQLPMSIK